MSRIGGRPFTGNTVSLNNRNFNVGNNLYQPSYYRHSGYHGYWNGNRSSNFGNNAVSAIGYGPGSGYGSNFGYGNYRGFNNYGGYNGYGNGWGWGLGNGFGGGRGYRSYGGYGYRPLGWGLAGWGLGSLIYNSGYLGYSNPYYTSGGTTVYNYTQPIPVYYNAPVATAAPVATVENDLNSAESILNSAVEAFRQNDYDKALDITNKGISQYSDDAVLHEFRSLVLFAKQDYQQSAATIHSVLAVGPGWDWTTLVGMYLSVETYTLQLRALEAWTKSNPQDAASQFLLAYHYMTCGHTDAAVRRLQQVVTLMPNDRVAADLLKMIAPPDAATDTNTTPPRPAPQPIDHSSEASVSPVDSALLIGAWKATRDDGSAFNLTMTGDAKFTWSFAQKGQTAQEFGGTYSVEGNILALERTNGGSLIAEVTPHAPGKFNFRLVGAADDDKGLEFSK